MSTTCETLTQNIIHRHENLFETMPLGCLVIDLNGDIIDVNPKALEILGSPSAEATKQINMLTFQPLIDAGVSAIAIRSLGGESKIVHDIYYTSCWGKTAAVRFTATPIYDEQDYVCLTLIMMEDMTDYTSLKCELERNNKMLKAIIDNIPSMIWLKDVDGRYLFTNKSFDEFNQFTNTDPIGKTDAEIWPKDQADSFTVEDISVRECEYLLEKTDAIIHPVYGPKHYHTIKVGVCDKTAKLVGTVGISCDVTKQVERDKILAEAIDTLMASLNGNIYVK